MVTYKQRRGSYALIVGVLVFLLAMTVTFSNVYGLDHHQLPSPGNPSVNNSSGLDVSLDQWQGISTASQGDYYDPSAPINAEPPSVPEPATMTLLLLGGGALLMSTKKRNP